MTLRLSRPAQLNGNEPTADVPVARTINTVELPVGFVAQVGNIGIKDNTPDVLLLCATPSPATAAGVFTQSLFSGPSVTLSRKNIAAGTAQAVVIVSKNANVATGEQGHADAQELAELTAAACGCHPADVIVGSTGVIGVPYPMDKVRNYFHQLGQPDFSARSAATSVEQAARAIMTTDTHPKTSEATAGNARVVGIAKGVGMIEPDMATMLAVIVTDAALPADGAALPADGAALPADGPALLADGAALPAEPNKDSQAKFDAMFKRVADRTFNALSIDTDTSTSDMAVLLASGAAGPVAPAELEAALLQVCTDLTRQLAADGEGAETLIVVTVDEALNAAQAKRVAKAIVNSPLVKTAVHGCDPNWGRVAMAIGKCYDQDSGQGTGQDTGQGIAADEVVIRFGSQEVYPRAATAQALAQLSDYLRQDEVLIHVSLGTGTEAFTVYGCDLTDGYVRINADYTT